MLLARHYLALSLKVQGRLAPARAILRGNLVRLRDRYGDDDEMVERTESALRAIVAASS